MMKSLKKATALLTLAGVVMASGSAFAMPRGHMHRHDRHINRMEQGYNVHSPKSHGPHYGHKSYGPIHAPHGPRSGFKHIHRW